MIQQEVKNAEQKEQDRQCLFDYISESCIKIKSKKWITFKNIDTDAMFSLNTEEEGSPFRKWLTESLNIAEEKR